MMIAYLPSCGLDGETGLLADDIRKLILDVADQRGPGKTFLPSEVAMLIDQHNWQKLTDQVKLVADALIHEGKIVATKNDTEIRLSLPSHAEGFTKSSS